jgi:aquaporin Z
VAAAPTGAHDRDRRHAHRRGRRAAAHQTSDERITMSQVTPEPLLLTETAPLPPAPAPTTGPSLVARAGAELFGTFLVVLAGLGTFLFSSYSGAGTLGVALAFGFGTVAAMTAVGHVSGGHLNPAITLGSAVAGRTRWSHVLPYWLAQIVGAVAASSVVFVVLSAFEPFAGSERTQFTALANGYDVWTPLVRTTDTASQMVGLTLTGALVLEAVLTAVLVGVALAVTGTRKAARTVAPVAVGLTLTLAMLVAIPLTNGGLNPARSLAAAIYSDSWVWGQIWVFVGAPLVGALVAGLLYRAFATGSLTEAELDELDDDELDLLDLDDEAVLVLDDVEVLDEADAPVEVEVLVAEETAPVTAAAEPVADAAAPVVETAAPVATDAKAAAAAAKPAADAAEPVAEGATGTAPATPAAKKPAAPRKPRATAASKAAAAAAAEKETGTDAAATAAGTAKDAAAGTDEDGDAPTR